MSERVASVDLSLLDVSDQKHRLKLEIESLAESIRNVGQINPITVKKVGARYHVIAGRRRCAALKQLQEETGKKVKALVRIVDMSQLEQELVTIDENIIRQNLTEIEQDEAIYRRKQIYEELHPETKQHVAGGVAKAKPGKKVAAFAKDAARKLNISRRSVEKAISRAARASDAVKKARSEGLLQSKVDLLVMLDSKDQDILLPVIKTQDLADTKALIEKAKKHGAKAAVLYLEDEAKEDPALKPLVRDAARLAEALEEATKDERILRGERKFDHLRMLERLEKNLANFLALQREHMGFVKAIRRTSDGRRKVISETRQ